MKQLYKVERHFFMMAEDESEAESYTPLDPLCCTNLVIKAKSVGKEWENAIPFNSNNDMTCQQILDTQEK